VLAGNVGVSLLSKSPCAVAVAPNGYRQHATGAFNRVTLGFDGTYESGLALLGAIALARVSGSSLHLIAVTGDGDARKALADPLQEAVRSVPIDLSAEGTVASGNPAQVLVDAAGDSGALVIGSRARGPLRRAILGSVSGALVRSARCPVLVHPRVTRIR
jgi:nucleotide-binding universal stress UspA family protein